MPKKAPCNGKKGATSWAKDVKLITCLLRLRAQPPVPYLRISDFFITTKPTTVELANQQLANQAQSSSRPQNLHKEMKEWMIDFLPEMFETAEKEKSPFWVMAREWDERVIGEILKVTKLADEGYGVADREEIEVQIKWRKEGDWRAGSEPLSLPLTRVLKGSIGSNLGVPVALKMPQKMAQRTPASSNEPVLLNHINHGWGTPKLLLSKECKFGVNDASKDNTSVTKRDKGVSIRRKPKDTTRAIINTAKYRKLDHLFVTQVDEGNSLSTKREDNLPKRKKRRRYSRTTTEGTRG